MARAVNDNIVIDSNTTVTTCINNGLPGEVMRKAMENKNALQKQGSMYIGTGTKQTITIADTNSEGIEGNYEVAITDVLNPPEANGTYILKCVVSSGSVSVSWEPAT